MNIQACISKSVCEWLLCKYKHTMIHLKATSNITRRITNFVWSILFFFHLFFFHACYWHRQLLLTLLCRFPPFCGGIHFHSFPLMLLWRLLCQLKPIWIFFFFYFFSLQFLPFFYKHEWWLLYIMAAFFYKGIFFLYFEDTFTYPNR